MGQRFDKLRKSIAISDLGFVASITTVLSILFILIPNEVTMFSKILMIIIIILFSVAIVIAINYLSKSKIIKLPKGKIINIKIGNILDENDIAIIPVNRNFDTIVDDRIISRCSVHGQFIEKYFKDNIVELDRQIDESLEGIGFEPVQRNVGKTKLYPVGTTAIVTSNEKKFYMLALTTFDESNVSNCSVSDYYLSISRLLEFIDRNSQGYPVCMPIIGGGLSRIRVDEKKDLIETLISMIKVFGFEIPSKISIIVYEEDAKSMIIRHLD